MLFHLCKLPVLALTLGVAVASSVGAASLCDGKKTLRFKDVGAACLNGFAGINSGGTALLAVVFDMVGGFETAQRVLDRKAGILCKTFRTEIDNERQGAKYRRLQIVMQWDSSETSFKGLASTVVTGVPLNTKCRKVR